MIQESYVSFETSKLLKEKGFDEDIDLWYDESGNRFFAFHFSISRDWRVRQNQQVYECPTQQMAMRWLREEKEIAIVIKPYPNEDGFCYVYEIKKLIGRDNFLIRKVEPIENKAGFDSYEDACEAAIQYCLENLI